MFLQALEKNLKPFLTLIASISLSTSVSPKYQACEKTMPILIEQIEAFFKTIIEGKQYQDLSILVGQLNIVKKHVPTQAALLFDAVIEQCRILNNPDFLNKENKENKDEIISTLEAEHIKFKDALSRRPKLIKESVATHRHTLKTEQEDLLEREEKMAAQVKKLQAEQQVLLQLAKTKMEAFLKQAEDHQNDENINYDFDTLVTFYSNALTIYHSIPVNQRINLNELAVDCHVGIIKTHHRFFNDLLRNEDYDGAFDTLGEIKDHYNQAISLTPDYLLDEDLMKTTINLVYDEIRLNILQNNIDLAEITLRFDTLMKQINEIKQNQTDLSDIDESYFDEYLEKAEKKRLMIIYAIASQYPVTASTSTPSTTSSTASHYTLFAAATVDHKRKHEESDHESDDEITQADNKKPRTSSPPSPR